jgi:hypothetical protein
MSRYWFVESYVYDVVRPVESVIDVIRPASFQVKVRLWPADATRLVRSPFV